jgi:hypothetical protein
MTPWSWRESAARIMVMTAIAEITTPEAEPRDRLGGSSAAAEDPAHALYAEAAGLMATAHALEAATHASSSVAAAAPTLACMEASLTALATAVERLRGHALRRLSEPVFSVDDLRPQRADIALHLERLTGILEQGSYASAQARYALQPVLDELTVV